MTRRALVNLVPIRPRPIATLNAKIENILLADELAGDAACLDDGFPPRIG
jgi:hypothetical protein